MRSITEIFSNKRQSIKGTSGTKGCILPWVHVKASLSYNWHIAPTCLLHRKESLCLFVYNRKCWTSPNKSQVGNSHRSHRTCQSPLSWSGRWVVWCTHSRHSSSPPLTAARRKRRPSETGSLPCRAPVVHIGLRLLPQVTNRNTSSTYLWLAPQTPYCTFTFSAQGLIRFHNNHQPDRQSP